MIGMDHDGHIRTMEDLGVLYGAVAPPSAIKKADHVHPVYRPFIEAAPFVVLATAGASGLDAPPAAIQQPSFTSKTQEH
jgi:predicted pyridoxine 5'-phosphate oxidase superfamily flavin-nucleotide-binding protein